MKKFIYRHLWKLPLIIATINLIYWAIPLIAANRAGDMDAAWDYLAYMWFTNLIWPLSYLFVHLPGKVKNHDRIY